MRGKELQEEGKCFSLRAKDHRGDAARAPCIHEDERVGSKRNDAGLRQSARNRTGLRPQDETMSDVRTTVSKCVGGRTCLSQVQVIGSVARRLWSSMRADAFEPVWRGRQAMAPGARTSNSTFRKPRGSRLWLERILHETNGRSPPKWRHDSHEYCANETHAGRPKWSRVGDQRIAVPDIRFDTAPLRCVRQSAREL